MLWLKIARTLFWMAMLLQVFFKKSSMPK